MFRTNLLSVSVLVFGFCSVQKQEHSKDCASKQKRNTEIYAALRQNMPKSNVYSDEFEFTIFIYLTNKYQEKRRTACNRSHLKLNFFSLNLNLNIIVIVVVELIKSKTSVGLKHFSSMYNFVTQIRIADKKFPKNFFNDNTLHIMQNRLAHEMPHAYA